MFKWAAKNKTCYTENKYLYQILYSGFVSWMPNKYILMISRWKQNLIRNITKSNAEIYFPAGNYMSKVNNKNTRTRCGRCSKLTIKTPERRQWHRSGVFVINLEYISRLVLVFLFNFVRVNAGCVNTDTAFIFVKLICH